MGGGLLGNVSFHDVLPVLLHFKELAVLLAHCLNDISSENVGEVHELLLADKEFRQKVLQGCKLFEEVLYFLPDDVYIFGTADVGDLDHGVFQKLIDFLHTSTAQNEVIFTVFGFGGLQSLLLPFGCHLVKGLRQLSLCNGLVLNLLNKIFVLFNSSFNQRLKCEAVVLNVQSLADDAVDFLPMVLRQVGISEGSNHWHCGLDSFYLVLEQSSDGTFFEGRIQRALSNQSGVFINNWLDLVYVYVFELGRDPHLAQFDPVPKPSP